MKRTGLNNAGRRVLFVLMIGGVLLSIGCEAILDFDRGPLQPVVEASVVETGATVPDAGKKDSGKTGDDDDDDDDGKDAGKDAGDAGDAGDSGKDANQ